MATWNEAEPPVLKPSGLPARMLGGVRLVVMILATLVLFIFYLLGKALERAIPAATFRFTIAKTWSRIGLFLIGLKLHVVGEPIRGGGMLASNHISWSDILVLRATGAINFVSKAEVRDWPVVGFIAAVCDTVFVVRRRTDAKRQNEALLERLRAGELLCIFPEATSTDGQRVLQFKSSLFAVAFETAAAADMRVQPVTLHYAPRPDHDLPQAFYGWWGDMAFGGHIWDVMTRSFGGAATVVFHPAVRASDFADRKSLAKHCEDQVAGGHKRLAAGA